MKRSVSWVRIGFLAGILALPAVAMAVDLALDAVPANIMATIKARFPDIPVTGAAKEKNEAGVMIYEINLDDKGMAIDATLTTEGALMLVETQIDRKDLPENVAKVYEEKYPKARYKLVERVTSFKDKEESLAYYEILLVTPQKQIRSVEVSPEGKVLKIEKKVTEDEDD